MKKQTIVEYVLERLSKLGISDCFGLPGDYAFPLNDAIASCKSVNWRGCSNELKAAVDTAISKIEDADTGCDLPAFTVSRFGLQTELTALVEAIGLPFATTAMDKDVLSEAHPQFIGNYAGKFSAANVLEAVEGADVVIDAGGVLFTYFSTGGFSQDIDLTKIITIGIDSTKIDGQIYPSVFTHDIPEYTPKKNVEAMISTIKNECFY